MFLMSSRMGTCARHFFASEAQVKWESASEVRPTPRESWGWEASMLLQGTQPNITIYFFLLDQVLSWKIGFTFQQIKWATNLNTEQAMQPPGVWHSKPWQREWWQLLGQLEVPRERKKQHWDLLLGNRVLSFLIVSSSPSKCLHKPTPWNRTF